MTPTRLNLKYILIGTYDCSESSYLCIKTKIKVQETHCLGFLLNKGDKNKHPPHTPAGGYRTARALIGLDRRPYGKHDDCQSRRTSKEYRADEYKGTHASLDAVILA